MPDNKNKSSHYGHSDDRASGRGPADRWSAAGRRAFAAWVLVGGALSSVPALADCTDSAGDGNWQCSGDLSPGVEANSATSTPPNTADAIDVANLSAPITGSDFGILWQWLGEAYDTPAQALDLNVDTGSYNIVTGTLPGSGGAEASVQATSEGYSWSPSPTKGHPGGVGGDVTLEFTGDIQTNAGGIYLYSSGGNGEHGDSHDGGDGGQSGDVNLSFAGSITPAGNQPSTTPGGNGALIYAVSAGATGGKGASNSTGGAGGASGAVTLSIRGTLGPVDLPGQPQPNTRNAAIYGASLGGDGGLGGDADVFGYAGAGGRGGSTSPIALSTGALSLTAKDMSGLYLLSQGGLAADGNSGGSAGGAGGAGGNSNSITVTPGASLNIQISTGAAGNQSSGNPAIFLQGIGGNGGAGYKGNDAGSGGYGGKITFNDSDYLHILSTSSSRSPGVLAISQGGIGGNGDAAHSNGGPGGFAYPVQILGSWAITTNETQSPGIVAVSHGGGGGDAYKKKSSGGNSGNGSWIQIDSHGSGQGQSGITTRGADSAGILAQSIGGRAGSASGGGFQFVSFAANGGSAGDGESVTVNVSSPITTQGDGSDAIKAQSIGGGGGSGGSNFGAFYSAASSGGQGGNGGDVTVDNSATLNAAGNDAHGVLAQSIGGAGGDGGSGNSTLVALGGNEKDNSSGGGNGGTVEIDNTGKITTGSNPGTAPENTDPTCSVGCSPGIVGQSIGGGGGHGGSTVGWFSVGGTGGAGGSGGQVTVSHLNAAVDTQLDNSTAIMAQSVGGGGGNGGSAVAAGLEVSLAVGGAGGGGGNGGAATASASGGMSITTAGANSHGLFAQSVGGGGGNGGFAGALSVSPDDSSPSLAIAIGGKGGNGGDGGEAYAYTADHDSPGNNSITTSGDYASGIVAQSVGGGGGGGGFATSTSVAVTQAFAFAVGGSGGGGGDGGFAASTNNANVTTHGEGANAVLVQSIGGGGGHGGWSETAGLGLFEGGLSLAFGGAGGSGGDADSVTICNGTTQQSGNVCTSSFTYTPGTLTTTGSNADGILAQSIGGGGGAGGISLGADAGGPVTENLSFTIGGSGGTGGDGGGVNVGNQGAITVGGGGSSALMAQSIGGGGGKGAASLAGTAAPNGSFTESIALGGAAGSGGVGGPVTVQNSGELQATGTAGDNPDFSPGYGILAQSIGGGGGQGGFAGSLAFQATSSTDDEPPSVSLPISLGGAGGNGKAGGIVSVTNSGGIVTSGNQSPAIVAQSVGGGGGVAGNSTAWNRHAPGLGGATVSMAVALGAAGGNGSTGGGVTVSNSGAIHTAGNGSSGVFAQSVGGGGGSGTHSIAENQSGLVDQFANPGNGGDKASAEDGGGEDENENLSPSFNLAMGGKGGSGNNGGNVTVTSSAAIQTAGTHAHGIFAQSVGGGGGTGGDEGNEDETDPTGALAEANDDEYQNLTVTLGGNGGATGDGGTVQVTHQSGAITTAADGSAGIYAQSVGGGGGEAGAAGTGEQGSFAMGGSGTAGGKGGDITVHFKGGSIQTQGAGIEPSFGIFAQSVGGGGGEGGMGQLSNWQHYGTKLALGGGGGSGGDGGEVQVDFDAGSISTSADGAVGIFAQSVGGGGGLKGGVTREPGIGKVLAGNNGDPGDGGDVTVDVGGSITTSGGAAHGVFAQSIGTGNSGVVTVSVSGSIHASGAAADGIYAQSALVGSLGSVTVNVDSGATVSGGGAAPAGTDASDGAGIVIQSAVDSGDTVTNKGTITSIGGSSGTAIVFVDSGDVSVQNSGTIVGQVRCYSSSGGSYSDCSSTVVPPGADSWLLPANAVASGGITLINQSGGLIEAGAVLDVAQLTNDGTLSVAGTGRPGATLVTGNLTQGSSGTLVIDLDPGRGTDAGSADLLRIGGTTQLAGRLSPRLVDDWEPALGPKSVAVIQRVDGQPLDAGALLARPSAVAQYRLSQPSPDALYLNYDIDFANTGILALTNDNQDELARYLDRVYGAGGLARETANELINIGQESTYAQVMNTLSAEVTVDNQIGSLLSSLRFGDELLGCARREGEQRFLELGQCGWLRVDGRSLDQDSTDDNLGFDEDSWQVTGGGQFELGGDWYAGGGFSYEDRNLHVDHSNARSDGYQLQGGVFAKRRIDALELSGTLSVGYGDFDIDRLLWPDERADSTQKLWLTSGQLRAACLFDQGGWYLRPRVDLGFDYLSVDGFDESGSSDLRLRMDGQNDTYYNVQPALELGADYSTEGGTLLRPQLTLGITRFLGDADPSTTARFLASDVQVPSFTTSTDMDKTRFDVAAWIDIFTSSDIVARAEVFGSFSNNIDSYGGGLKLSIPF